jgi:hypothetical protein
MRSSPALAIALEEPTRTCFSGFAPRTRSTRMRLAGAPPGGAPRAVGLVHQPHAFFQVARDRHEDHAKRLLADTQAVVTSERWWAYRNLPIRRRQLCWSHLQRDFAAHAEGLAVEKEFGEHGLELSQKVSRARAADQQPRRARAAQRSHLPQAQPRQPIRGRRTADRATVLRAHHLPPTRPIAVRLTHRNAQRPRPRRPCPAARLSRHRRGLNAYRSGAS